MNPVGGAWCQAKASRMSITQNHPATSFISTKYLTPKARCVLLVNCKRAKQQASFQSLLLLKLPCRFSMELARAGCGRADSQVDAVRLTCAAACPVRTSALAGNHAADAASFRRSRRTRPGPIATVSRPFLRLAKPRPRFSASLAEGSVRWTAYGLPPKSAKDPKSGHFLAPFASLGGDLWCPLYHELVGDPHRFQTL